jgi:hypothetical protein
MGGVAQVAMRVASQIWQVVFASQTLSGFLFGPSQKGTICSSVFGDNSLPKKTLFMRYMAKKTVFYEVYRG